MAQIPTQEARHWPIANKGSKTTVQTTNATVKVKEGDRVLTKGVGGVHQGSSDVTTAVRWGTVLSSAPNPGCNEMKNQR